MAGQGPGTLLLMGAHPLRGTSPALLLQRLAAAKRYLFPFFCFVPKRETRGGGQMGDRRHLWGLCYRPLGAKEEGSDALCWMSRLFRPFPRKSERNCLKKKEKDTHKSPPEPLQGSHFWGGGEIPSRFVLQREEAPMVGGGEGDGAGLRAWRRRRGARLKRGSRLGKIIIN